MQGCTEDEGLVFWPLWCVTGTRETNDSRVNSLVEFVPLCALLGRTDDKVAVWMCTYVWGVRQCTHLLMSEAVQNSKRIASRFLNPFWSVQLLSPIHQNLAIFLHSDIFTYGRCSIPSFGTQCKYITDVGKWSIRSFAQGLLIDIVCYTCPDMGLNPNLLPGGLIHYATPTTKFFM